MNLKQKTLQKIILPEEKKDICKLYLDVGRTEIFSKEDFDLLLRVKEYFKDLDTIMDVYHDNITNRKYCSVYLFYREKCSPDCPAYIKKEKVKLQITKHEFEK
jgi:hypothetical protein